MNDNTVFLTPRTTGLRNGQTLHSVSANFDHYGLVRAMFLILLNN